MTNIADVIDPIPDSPDCAAGKHTACVGDSFDETDGVVVDCPCSCHDGQGSAGIAPSDSPVRLD